MNSKLVRMLKEVSRKGELDVMWKRRDKTRQDKTRGEERRGEESFPLVPFASFCRTTFGIGLVVEMKKIPSDRVLFAYEKGG